MALYKIEINKKVRKKDLSTIAAADVKKIVKRIQKLAEDPYPANAIQLKGREEWRIRQGNYRILYIVNEQIITVFVVKIGHRRDVYKKQ